MRIVAGTHRGRRLSAPRGGTTRPTADRVREALFSIVGPVDGLDALDLFAGSGALGLEALSRGAATATLVERDPRAVAVIRANAASLGLEDRVTVVAADWRSALRAQIAARRAFGLCLLDPPYARAEEVLRVLGTTVAPVMTDPGIVVVERPAALPPPHPEGMEIAHRTDRTYGDTGVSVLRLAP